MICLTWDELPWTISPSPSTNLFAVDSSVSPLAASRGRRAPCQQGTGPFRDAHASQLQNPSCKPAGEATKVAFLFHFFSSQLTFLLGLWRNLTSISAEVQKGSWEAEPKPFCQTNLKQYIKTPAPQWLGHALDRQISQTHDILQVQ